MIIKVCGIFLPFCGFRFPLSLTCLLLSDADPVTLGRGAPSRLPTATTHQTTYIPNSTHDELQYVQHYLSESGFLLTFFGVFGLHAVAVPPWAFVAVMDVLAHERNKNKQACILFQNTLSVQGVEGSERASRMRRTPSTITTCMCSAKTSHCTNDGQKKCPNRALESKENNHADLHPFLASLLSFHSFFSPKQTQSIPPQPASVLTYSNFWWFATPRRGNSCLADL